MADAEHLRGEAHPLWTGGPKVAQRKWKQANRERLAEYKRQYRQSHPEQNARVARKCLYGLTEGRYLRLLEEQEDGCAICGRIPGPGEALHVDHCHSTGEVRGLLCLNCNHAIGKMGDSPDRLREAADYLEGKGAGIGRC